MKVNVEVHFCVSISSRFSSKRGLGLLLFWTMVYLSWMIGGEGGGGVMKLCTKFNNWRKVWVWWQLPSSLRESTSLNCSLFYCLNFLTKERFAFRKFGQWRFIYQLSIMHYKIVCLLFYNNYVWCCAFSYLKNKGYTEWVIIITHNTSHSLAQYIDSQTVSYNSTDP